MSPLIHTPLKDNRERASLACVGLISSYIHIFVTLDVTEVRINAIPLSP
jgi:hypothetical protein